MKVLIAPDKFKASLSAKEVCRCIKKGLDRQKGTLKIIEHPMADGGDGSLEVLSDYLELKIQKVQTVDALGRAITAQYFISADAAFIDVASASGLVLLKDSERDPMQTSSYGTGKIIADAIAKGFKKIYLFLGGSATNDAGIGIASALGYQFLDDQKRVLKPMGENLGLIKSIIKPNGVYLNDLELILLCDVTNPMFGKNGAAHIYAPQKGASIEQVRFLDNGLKMFSSVLQQYSAIDVSTIDGGGAAGAIGAGLSALFGAKIESGFEVVAALTKLERRIQQVDCVISGEGNLDIQSLQGKVVDGISKLCQKYQKTLYLLVGNNELGTKDLEIIGVKNVFSITDKAHDMSDAMANGSIYLEEMAASLSLSSLMEKQENE